MGPIWDHFLPRTCYFFPGRTFFRVSKRRRHVNSLKKLVIHMGPGLHFPGHVFVEGSTSKPRGPVPARARLGPIWGPYGAHMGQYGSIWGPFVPFGPKSDPFGPNLGSFEPIWAQFGPIWGPGPRSGVTRRWKGHSFLFVLPRDLLHLCIIFNGPLLLKD